MYNIIWSCTDVLQCPPSEILRTESQEIDKKFAKVTNIIYQSLLARDKSKEDLKACLIGFSCCTPVFVDSDQLEFHEQRKKFNDPSATLTTVWNVVGEYFSFFDYDILEMIVDTLGTDQDKQVFAEYEKDFKAYAEERLVIDKQGDPDTDGHSTTIMFIKLDSSYNGCEIGHLKALQRKLTALLNIENGVLQLRRVMKGSVQLVFEILYIVDVFPLSSKQELALQELGVEQLDCGNYHYRHEVIYLCMLRWVLSTSGYENTRGVIIDWIIFGFSSTGTPFMMVT